MTCQPPVDWSIRTFRTERRRTWPTCVSGKDDRQAQGLLEVHRAARPDDPNLPAWDLEVRWLRKDHERVRKLPAEREEEVFSLPRSCWKAADHRLRSPAPLGRDADTDWAAKAVVKTCFVLIHPLCGRVR